MWGKALGGSLRLLWAPSWPYLRGPWFPRQCSPETQCLHCLAQLDVQPKVGSFQVNKWEYLIVCKPSHRINSAPLAAKLWTLTVIGNVLKMETKRILEEFKNNGHYTKWQRRRDTCSAKVLFCYQWNIQEHKQTWAKTSPGGVWAREKLPHRRGAVNPEDTTVPSFCL